MCCGVHGGEKERDGELELSSLPPSESLPPSFVPLFRNPALGSFESLIRTA